MPGVFITGTDTDVGKTWVGSRLAQHLHQKGIPVSPRKPIESGCETVDNMLIPKDGLCYFNAIEQTEPLSVICPIRLKAAISPALAALLEQRNITLRDAIQSCHCLLYTSPSPRDS